MKIKLIIAAVLCALAGAGIVAVDPDLIMNLIGVSK